MNGGAILPHGEALRSAVRWLSQQPRHDAATVETAAQRFDLSPLEEAFLLEHFVSGPSDRQRDGSGMP